MKLRKSLPVTSSTIVCDCDSTYEFDINDFEIRILNPRGYEDKIIAAYCPIFNRHYNLIKPKPVQ